MEHFGTVFKLDITEETRKQLQEADLILATVMGLHLSSRIKHNCVSMLRFTDQDIMQQWINRPQNTDWH